MEEKGKGGWKGGGRAKAERERKGEKGKG